jgi:hypothetical protein
MLVIRIGFLLNLACLVQAKAQTDIYGLFMGNSIEDASKLMRAYYEPQLNLIQAGLQVGWFNTAETYRPLRFDVRVSLGNVYERSTDRTFDVNSLGLQSVRVAPGQIPGAVTALGGTAQGLTMQLVAPMLDPALFPPNTPASALPSVQQFANNSAANFTYQLPNNSEAFLSSFSNFPDLANFQLTMGVVKNTDVVLRLSGSTQVANNVFGIGLKHDLTQWINNWKDKNLHFSFTLAYTFGVGGRNVEALPRIFVSANGEPITRYVSNASSTISMLGK